MNRTIEKYARTCLFAFLTMLYIASFAAGAGEGAAALEQKIPNNARQKLQTKITYSCTNLPIETVLMNLADQANIDIIKSPEVTGDVTVKVTNVPLEEALTNILAAHNYTYIATENMIRVMKLSEMAAAREETVTRIYRLNYADANNVASALATFVSAIGKVALNKGTSHIIVTDTEDRVKAIDKFIEEIDSITPQVLVEVRIYDIISQEGFEFDSSWHAGRNAPLTADTTVLPTEVTTTEIGTSRTDYHEGRTDTRVGTGPFVETRLEDSWTTESGRTDTESRYLPAPIITTNRRRKPFVGGSFDRITGGTLSFSLLNDAVDIDLALSILSQQVEARLLANPRVLVLDNETANFETIRQLPYREYMQVGRADPITYTAFKNVGVHLKVTPHIARDGLIKLHIIPEFGVVVSQNLDGAPTVDTRRANTIALVKDGQTIAIGGLRKTETSKDITKVPVLGDIPLVGALFMSQTEVATIHELVVFITPRIVTKPALSEIERKQFETAGSLLPQTVSPTFEEPDITGSLDKLLRKLNPTDR